ncbi:unnamed protein product [Heligmosomoides polygyrus]|uniref:Phlebovirus_G2 domain-containing protein n=1 Tax=Heligmosomoides polygyrus TaxID=6339 RepID=A0A183F9H2_HELPZ|nr:unnamed protein product [Heligmosomoides polygyrus]
MKSYKLKITNSCRLLYLLKVQHPIRGVTTAMTCLPHDSLIHSYHPEGCRTELSTGEKLCLCSERDFCNSATRSVLSLVSLFLFMTLLL